MQITFDTSNPKDLDLLNQILAFAQGVKAQPAVAQNTGTTATGLDLSPEGSGVGGAGASGVPGADQPAPATEKKVKAKKSAAPAAEQVGTSETPEKSSSTAPDAPTATDKPLTLDEVRAALQTFTASKGVPAGVELLKKYNAGRISELEESNYAAFAADCAA